MHLIFEQIETGGDRNFGYLFGEREAKMAALIDPSYNPEPLIERANLQGLKVSWIINTHGHHDHTNGNEKAQDITGAPIAIYEKSTVAHDYAIKDLGEIKIGSLTLKFIFTPGHCADHLVVYNPEYHIAMTGDHIFVGKIGGTVSEEAAREEFRSLKRVYDELPLETTIWPGHNYGCRPSSTLAIEKTSNPFIQCDTIEKFLELKANWPALKKEKGLL